MRVLRKFQKVAGFILGSILPPVVAIALANRLSKRNPRLLFEVIGPYLNRDPDLDKMPFDLPTGQTLKFEHLSGLFASTPLDYAVITMSIREAAYLFGLIRQMPAHKVIEIGRYKGGSTFLIAAAMDGKGQLWSIDIGEKERRLHSGKHQRCFDEQIVSICEHFGLKVHIVVGDSRTIDINVQEVDLVFIDGDHSYQCAKNDFERFGKRVRPGGAVLFHNCFDNFFRVHSDGVSRVIKEIITSKEFRLVKSVNSIAHLKRIG